MLGLSTCSMFFLVLSVPQLLTLKEQLDQETRRRQAFFTQMLQPGV